jgi:hypothetical protein
VIGATGAELRKSHRGLEAGAIFPIVVQGVIVERGPHETGNYPGGWEVIHDYAIVYVSPDEDALLSDLGRDDGNRLAFENGLDLFIREFHGCFQRQF